MFNYPQKLLSSILSSSLLSLILGLLPIAGDYLLASANTIKKPDPLLPPSSIYRPLTEFEIGRIQRKIKELNIQANAELSGGNLDKAFEFWYRELTLQRGLGLESEIKALGRIGSIAWSNNRSSDLRIIAKRLALIQQQLQKNNHLQLQQLELLAKAYEQTHYIDRAISLTQKLLIETRNDRELKLKTLDNLGNLYLAKFDYREAGEVYEELLTEIDLSQQVINTNNSRLEVYLDRLAIIYAKTDRPQKAIGVKQRLIKYFTDAQKIDKLASLNLSIAKDYVLLNDLQAADRTYRKTFALASNLKQFALAGEALTDLAEIYQKNALTSNAIEIYQKLITIQKQAYDYYNLANTYDKLGQIYQQIGDFKRAKMAFQQGLEVAKSLKYKVDYFTNLVNSIK